MCRTPSFRRCSVSLPTVLLVWSWVVIGGEPVPPVPPVGASESEDATVKVGVSYLTNRRRNDGRPVPAGYTGDRGDAHFGRCEVEFSPIPVIKQVASELPFYVQTETSVVSLAAEVAPQTFWEQLRESVDHSSSRSVVVFVHGYNYGFERTCRMAAEMQRSLAGKAVVVVFSWPSDGAIANYVSDLADVEWSAPLLGWLIAELGDRIGHRSVQVVAHSLGSRGGIFALQRFGAGRPERPAIGGLVLLAPDFDSQTFVDLLPDLSPLAGGITLYASDSDAPLKLSHQLSGYPRLGEAGEYLTVAKGMDTIDVSATGRYQITGHEYFYFNPLVVADLVALLGTGAEPVERPGLELRTRNGLPYWGVVAAE